jgi:hypothetical protein
MAGIPLRFCEMEFSSRKLNEPGFLNFRKSEALWQDQSLTEAGQRQLIL